MILLNTNRIARTLKRISMQIAEETKGSHIHLIGMNKRGLILATILQEHLSEILETTPELFNIKDGLPEESDPIPAPGSPTALIFVDDVIFSGGTIFRAMNQIDELRKYEKILITVLIDRGHRKYPLLASLVGEKVPTKLKEHVELLIDGDKPDKVILTTD